MIRYALACQEGHAFESWFGSADGFDAQQAAGLVQCPICGSSSVSKSIMAPSLSRSTAAPEPVPSEAKQQPVAILSEREHAMRAMLRSIREHVTKTADYVGPRFADEARRMHDGDIEHRSIYGEASALEAKSLIEDGIEVHPLPVMPDDRN